MDLIGEIVGWIAIAVCVLIYQQKTEKNLLLYKGTTDALWIAHYIIIGGYTGAAITCVALIREIVLFCNARRGVKSKRVLVLFLLASAVCTVITWQSVFSIFPAVGSLLAVTSFWIGKPKVLRIMSFPIAICMMIYGMHNGSVTVIVNESLVMLSSLLALCFKDRKVKEPSEA